MKDFDVLDEEYPPLKGWLKGDGGSLEWEEACFKSNTATLEISGKDATVTITSSDPADEGCYDNYLIATIYGFRGSLVTTEGPHPRKFKVSKEEIAEINERGLMIFSVPADSALVLAEFGEMIKIAMSDEPANREFTEKHMEFKYEQRPQPKYKKIDHSHFQSGDQLAVNRFKGTHTMCKLYTGARTGHVAMALWKGDKLFVVESTADGIQRVPWEQWMNHCVEKECMVAVLPLRKDLAEKFDEDAAWKFFETVEGGSYGFGGYIFPWLDTATENFPPEIDASYAELLLVITDALIPPAAMQIPLVGFNKRLGTTGLTTSEVLQECRDQGITLTELGMIPEQDDWLYDGEPMLVCSQIVTRLYREAGVLAHGENIKAGEQTPRDCYMMNMFDSEWADKPEECYDDLPYCQVMGEYVLDLPGYNTLDTYDNMSDKCPSVAPDYPRPAGC